MTLKSDVEEIDRNKDSMSYLLKKDGKVIGCLTLNAPYCDDEDKRTKLKIGRAHV